MEPTSNKIENSNAVSDKASVKRQTPTHIVRSSSFATIPKQDSNCIDTCAHCAYTYTYKQNAQPLDQSKFNFYSQVHGKNAIMLTFDCGWVDKKNADDLLDALKRNNIKATFFISGPFIFDHPTKGYEGGVSEDKYKLIKRMIDEGHEFGDHSQTHPHNKSSLNWTAQLSDLNNGWDKISKDLYPNGAPDNAKLKPYWRAPYGEYDEHSLIQAAKAGFPYHIGWNVDVRDSLDWPDRRTSPKSPRSISPESMTDAVLKFSDSNNNSLPGFVVLAHLENHYFWGSDDKNSFDKLATEMRNRGCTFALVSESLKTK